MDKENSRGHRKPEPQPEDERRGLGKRIAAARTLAGFTLDTAAQALLERGYPITRAAIGHWETGKNLPDALWLRRLAKLYGSTLDALVWDEAISMEGIQFAVQFDALNEADKRKFRAMWLAYFEQAKSDAEVAQHLPAAPVSGGVLTQQSGKRGVLGRLPGELIRTGQGGSNTGASNRPGTTSKKRSGGHA